MSEWPKRRAVVIAYLVSREGYDAPGSDFRHLPGSALIHEALFSSELLAWEACGPLMRPDNFDEARAIVAETLVPPQTKKYWDKMFIEMREDDDLFLALDVKELPSR